MLLVQILLRAICQPGRYRLRMVILPVATLVAAFGAAAIVASAAGAHPLHIVLAAGAHVLADFSTLTNGGGPPDP